MLSYCFLFVVLVTLSVSIFFFLFFVLIFATLMRSLGACRHGDFVYKVVLIHSGVEKLFKVLIYFQVRALNVRLMAFEVLQ